MRNYCKVHRLTPKKTNTKCLAHDSGISAGLPAEGSVNITRHRQTQGRKVATKKARHNLKDHDGRRQRKLIMLMRLGRSEK